MKGRGVLYALLALVLLSLLVAWLLPEPGGRDAWTARTDLPWQITVLSPHRLRVFDLVLPEATLRDGIAKFGQLESVSLFEGKGGQLSLEAYFGKVSLGPLKARVIARLDASQKELRKLASGALTMKYSASGDRQFVLDQDSIAAQLGRPIRALSYIPDYGGLDAAFFRKHFGEPAYYQRIDEHSVQWFYPRRGVRLLLNAKGKEVLEYQPPADFVVPEGATSNQ